MRKVKNNTAMTREEQIYSGAVEYVKPIDNILKQCFGEVFTDGANWADSHPNWHKYPDEKPLLEQWILIYTTKGRIVETVWHQPMLVSGEPYGEPTFKDKRYNKHNVIAWIERPKLPKFD